MRGRHFLSDQRGGVALIFAFALLPVALAVGVAIDFARAHNVRSTLQNALDIAALAAARTPVQLDAQRIETAQAMAIANWESGSLPALSPADITTTIIDDVVTVKSTLMVPATFMALANFPEVEVGASAAAMIAAGPTICLLALDPSGSSAIHFAGTAELNAKECAVHANSVAPDAMTHKSNNTAVALSFCVSGGFEGSKYAPTPEAECPTIKDPLVDLVAPINKPCNEIDFIASKEVITLTPGVYCGGMNLKADADVKLQPGLYVLRGGPFKVSSQATLIGEGVTVYLTGSNSYTNIQSGSSVTLTAATSGDYAGLVIIEDRDSITSGTTASTIQGDATTVVTGTVYAPKKSLTISGNGDFGLTTPKMAFIGYRLRIHGNGTLTILEDPDFPGERPREPGPARLIN